MTPQDKSKRRILVALVMACVLLIAGYAWRTAAPPLRNVALPPFSGQLPSGASQASSSVDVGGDRGASAPDVSASGTRELTSDARGEDSRPRVDSRPVESATTEATVHLPSPPRFLVRHTAMDLSYGRLAVESGTGSESSRQATSLTCQRVHFAGNRGSCLEARPSAITSFSVILFDAAFQPTARIPLAGYPSRTRVSPDGRYAATTVFVSGHSYADTDFSTATQIIDAVTGTPVVVNLEQMELWSGGARLTAPEANFWGVTFAGDSNRFYATLGLGEAVYLVGGNIAANRMTVVTEGIECPALSPDNTRVAGKKRVSGSPGKWRLQVLDLNTLIATPVAESRFIDEQVEWLDNNHLLYTQAAADVSTPAVTDVWTVPADGSGKPALLLRSAASPTLFHRTDP